MKIACCSLLLKWAGSCPASTDHTTTSPGHSWLTLQQNTWHRARHSLINPICVWKGFFSQTGEKSRKGGESGGKKMVIRCIFLLGCRKEMTARQCPPQPVPATALISKFADLDLSLCVKMRIVQHRPSNKQFEGMCVQQATAMTAQVLPPGQCTLWHLPFCVTGAAIQTCK